ncbi:MULTISPECIES: universal stress protein [unclassified Sulfitobacter]|uniref:universal stress protein n=1 Tax=unclassified Sulfitobacter TaxID=196795 RepID=UPI00374623A6
MYTKIMIPIDLKHIEQMGKALKVAADIGKLYGAEAHILGVGQTVPSQVARTPKEFADKLSAFALKSSESYGFTFDSHAEISHDPSVDLDNVLARAAKTIGSDLIVMASHTPGFAEHIFSSNAGYLASHADISVLVVR